MGIKDSLQKYSRQGKLFNLLMQIDSIELVDLNFKYRKKQTLLASGLGVSFTAKDENRQKEINEIAERHDILKLIRTALMHSKDKGRILIAPDISDSGVWTYGVSFYGMGERISKVMQQGQTAIVYKRPIKDDNTWLIKEVWDTEKVIRLWVYNNNETNTEGNKREIKPPYQITKPVVFHGLDYLPVFELKDFDFDLNEMFQDGLATDQYYSMDYSVAPLIEVYNNVLRISIVEAIATQTNKSYNVDPATAKKISANKSAIQQLLMQRISVTSKKVDEKGNSLGKMVELIQGQFQAGQYVEMTKSVEEAYAEGVGSSYQDGNRVEATATALYYSNSNDERTAKKDIQQIVNLVYKMFDAILKIGKNEERDYTFQIEQNSVIADNDKADYLLKLMNAGVITLKDVLQRLHGFDNDEDVQAYIDQLNAESEKDLLKHKERMDMLTATNEGEGGEPEPIKKEIKDEEE